MAKPLNEFGGWLRFFQISNFIGVIAMVIVSLRTILVGIEFVIEHEYNYSFIFFVIALDIIITAFFTIKILAIIKNQNENTPIRVRYFLLLIMIFAITFRVAEISFSYWFNGGKFTKEDFELIKGSLQGIAYCVMWRIYFIKSKRVNFFYKKADLHTVKAFQESSQTVDLKNKWQCPECYEYNRIEMNEQQFFKTAIKKSFSNFFSKHRFNFTNIEDEFKLKGYYSSLIENQSYQICFSFCLQRYEYDVTISKNNKEIHFGELFELEGDFSKTVTGSNKSPYDIFKGKDIEGLSNFLKWYAENIEHWHNEIDSNFTTLLLRVQDNRNSRCKEAKIKAINLEADNAYHNKNWNLLIKILEKHPIPLSKLQEKRLQYAKKHI